MAMTDKVTWKSVILLLTLDQVAYAYRSLIASSRITLIMAKLNYMNKFQLNVLPSDKLLDWSKLKAFADDKINIT